LYFSYHDQINAPRSPKNVAEREQTKRRANKEKKDNRQKIGKRSPRRIDLSQFVQVFLARIGINFNAYSPN